MKVYKSQSRFGEMHSYNEPMTPKNTFNNMCVSKDFFFPVRELPRRNKNTTFHMITTQHVLMWKSWQFDLGNRTLHPFLCSHPYIAGGLPCSHKNNLLSPSNTWILKLYYTYEGKIDKANLILSSPIYLPFFKIIDIGCLLY